MTDRYAVVGNPVAHSKSPLIHAEFARQTGQRIDYVHLLAPLDGFVRTVETFRAQGGKGLNVTVPFKLEAFRFAQTRSARASDAEAVNTLKFEGAQVLGDNTDGAGLVRDIQDNLAMPLAGRRLLLLGAGGAAQGVIGPLLDTSPASVVIANRTPDKAEALALRFRQRAGAVAIAGSGFAQLAGRSFDMVINATSASLHDDVPALPPGVFAPGALAYDMMYGKGLTPFLLRARDEGAADLADGLGMLVEQAAESFYVWRGVRPQSRPVIEMLKAL